MEKLMTWEELYPIVKEQANYAIMRYEERDRRKDKIQELVCQSYELYKSYIERNKPIRKQDFKCFVTQRAKQVDVRSCLKHGYGGTSTLDVLSFYRRRSDSPTPVVEFSDWMCVTPKTKENIEANLAFNVDYKEWLETLNKTQKRILDLLIQGFRCSKIAQMIHSTSCKVKQIIMELRQCFVEFFEIPVQHV